MKGAPGQPVGIRLAGLSVIDVGSVPTTGAKTFDATPALRQEMGPLAPVCKISAEPLAGITDPITKVIGPAAPVTGVIGTLPLVGTPAAPGASTARPPAAPAEQPQPSAATAPAPALARPAVGPFFGPMIPSDFPFALGQYNSGLPRYNYAELLQIGRPGAGALGRLSSGMLTADLFGTPQVSNGSGTFGKPSAAANDVAAAGRATALPASGVERIALPILVAVLMLASVTAALLRSWVLGRR
ncbi:MAG: hypothetical protein M3Y48_17825 [Actinomycetota bacterium]|nr:hypothetical protein [Actinomycetota bacterium]